MTDVRRSKTRCIKCEKEKATLRCSGCLEEFCYPHLQIHRQELNQELDDIEIHRNLLRELLFEHDECPNSHRSLQEINQWEEKTIEIIQKTAEQAREIIRKNFKLYKYQIEVNLEKLTQKLRQIREDDDFNEIDLEQFRQELKQITNEINRSPDITIREESIASINKIWIDLSRSSWKCNIHYNTIWKQNGITIAGGNGKGDRLNQLYYPFAILIDDDQTMYIADYENHRIIKWKYGENYGQIVAGGNGKGNQLNQLNHPTDIVFDRDRKNLIICDQDNRRVVQWSCLNSTIGQTIISNIDCRRLTIDDQGFLYVSDRRKHEVRRWKIGETNGILVAGGNGQGNGLHQLNEPSFIFVDKEQSVYVSDFSNHRVMKWMKDAKEGILITDNQGQNSSLSILLQIQGIFVDHLGSVYVADSDNHRIIRWFEEAREASIVVGGNEKGQKANQLSEPRGLAFDCQGNLYVADCENHRIQKFDIDQS